MEQQDEIVYIELPIMPADKSAAQQQIQRDYAKRINGRPVEFCWASGSSVYMTIKNEVNNAK